MEYIYYEKTHGYQDFYCDEMKLFNILNSFINALCHLIFVFDKLE